MVGAVRVLDKGLNLIGEVDQFDSFLLVRKNEMAGSFTLVVSGESKCEKLLKIGNYLYLDENRVCMILHKETEFTAKSTACEMVSVSGKTVECFLNNRVCVPLNAPGQVNAEWLLRTLVHNNLGQGASAMRKIPNLNLAPQIGISDMCIWNFKHANLGDIVSEICVQTSLGVKIKLDLNAKAFTFHVVKGVDHTVSQTLNPQIILSGEFDNILEQIYVESGVDEKNAAIVGGSGEGAAQRTIWVESGAQGIERREVFVEDRGLPDYSDKTLKEAGEKALLKTKSIGSLDCKINPHNFLKIGKDFDLGDFVTVKWRDIGLSKQIVEVTEFWDGDGYSVSCVFGKKPLGLLDKIKI